MFALEPSPIANLVIEVMIQDSSNKIIILTKAAEVKVNCTVELQLPTKKYLHSPSIIKTDSTFVSQKVPIITLDYFNPLRNLG